MIAQHAGLRRERAAGGDKDPARNQLLTQRLEARARVKTLAARCRATGPEHARALAVLTEALRTAEHELAGLDAALAGPDAEASVNVVPLAAPDDGVGPITAHEAQDQVRARLHFLLLVLGCVPDTCATAARTLRRAVGRELQQLEQLREGKP